MSEAVMPPPRARIIQFQLVPEGQDRERLLVLLDDGTLWWKYAGDVWRIMPAPTRDLVADAVMRGAPNR